MLMWSNTKNKPSTTTDSVLLSSFIDWLSNIMLDNDRTQRLRIISVPQRIPLIDKIKKLKKDRKKPLTRRQIWERKRIQVPIGPNIDPFFILFLNLRYRFHFIYIFFNSLLRYSGWALYYYFNENPLLL